MRFDTIKNFTDKVKQNLNDDSLNIVNAAKCCCEIMKKDVSKGNALKFLKEYLKYDYKNIACIGDAENDVEMAKIVTENGGMSISMGNGTIHLKEVSRFITSPVGDNGFSRAVETILNINKKNSQI